MASSKTRPRVFIGSSSEGRPTAEALVLSLHAESEPTIWNQGVFQLGTGTLASLVQTVSQFDFAVMILTPDDLVESRGQASFGPRDNVLFELGLFMGALGPDRTFMVYNTDRPPRLPSDLAGITAATFADREDGNIEAAIGVAATRLKQSFGRLGRRVGPHRSKTGGPSVYWCAPHRNVGRNNNARTYLESQGIAVRMPYDLVGARMRSEESPSPRVVRETCVAALLDSDVVVVDLDTYGLDSAWEIGFAEARGQPVIGFSIDEGVIVDARTIRRRRFNDNFMHGWDAAPVFDSLEALSSQCEGKIVHVCGSFRNERAMADLRASNLARTARRLILPKDAVTLGNEFPAQYPYRAREHAISLLAGADVAMVILPRYGMDTSWQIGYAAGLGKLLLGWKAAEVGPESEEAPIWNHWMHGWKEKITTTRLTDIAAVIHGFQFVYTSRGAAQQQHAADGAARRR